MCDQETRSIKVASGHGPIYYLTETFLLTSPCIGLISLDFPVFLWRFCFDLNGTANACCSVPPLDTRTFALLPFLDGVVSSSTFICMMPWYWNDNESNDGESSDLKRVKSDWSCWFLQCKRHPSRCEKRKKERSGQKIQKNYSQETSSTNTNLRLIKTRVTGTNMSRKTNLRIVDFLLLWFSFWEHLQVWKNYPHVPRQLIWCLREASPVEWIHAEGMCPT